MIVVTTTQRADGISTVAGLSIMNSATTLSLGKNFQSRARIEAEKR